MREKRTTQHSLPTQSLLGQAERQLPVWWVSQPGISQPSQARRGWGWQEPSLLGRPAGHCLPFAFRQSDFQELGSPTAGLSIAAALAHPY